MRTITPGCVAKYGLCPAFLAGVATMVASHAQTPEWIWRTHGTNDAPTEETAFFRKTFRTPPYLWNSRLTVSADDAAEVFLNGLSVATCDHWDRPLRTEVTVRLNQGENVIAIRARNRSGASGLLVDLDLGGEKRVVSDSSWLVSTNEEPGWSGLAFNAAHWSLASSLGAHGVEPWGDVLWRSAATPPEAITVPPGFRVELLRSAQPGEGSWVCLTLDDRGRIIISPQEEDRPMLRMTLRNGRVDRVEPVAEPIRQAMGLLWARAGLYANAKGPEGTGLHRLLDQNGDDRFEQAEARLLVGTKGGGEHGYHAVRLGPDGRLYVLNGNGTRLPEQVSAASAHRNYAQDVLPLGTEGNRMNQPAGFVLRGDPEGETWELWMGGLRNAYDFAFNEDGELFTFDSDMEWDWGTPWYRPTRILHCVSGAEFGWREERRVWPEYYEDSLPAVVDAGIGSPTGVEFGTRSRFPGNYRRAMFAMDWSYGRILAVHLEPQGASYRGRVETFLRGRPLNVTDLEFGPDGAMYFVTGGRGTQAGLYRVSWVGGPGGVTETIPAPDKTSAGAREARRKLEAFHGRADPKAVAAVWSSLGSDDRFMRYAARIALEHQPVDQWREQTLNEAHPGTALTALLAFARVAPKSSQAELLRALDRFRLDKLDEPARLLKLRVLQLAFLRQGRPPAELIDITRQELDPYFSAGSWEQNRELLRLMTWIEAPSTVAKALTLLDNASTQEQQLHYIEQLRHVGPGWTLANRRRYFQWWTRSRDDARHPPELLRWFADVDRQYVDGAWLDRYLNQFRRDAIDTLTETDRDELASLLNVQVRQARLVPSHNRGFVRDWTMADLMPHLRQGESPRDFESGRQAFVDAQCLACHRMGNDGGSIGPELNSAGSKYDRRTLLESILEPSKVLNEQYSNHTIRLKSGDDITGRIVSEEGDNLVVETNPFGGEQEEIDRKDILEIQPARVSPMPEGLASVLTRDEILALIAYLQSGGRKDAFASTPRDPGQD